MSAKVLDSNGNTKTNSIGDPVDIAHGGTGQATAGNARGALNAEFTTTSTGNIDDLDFSNASIIRMNNASLSTIRGLKAGTTGQQVTIVSVGAGQVNFAHQDAGSSAANRLINGAITHTFLIKPGSGSSTFQYDGTTARWRLIAASIGGVTDYLTYPGYTAGDFTESSGTWTVDNPGDIQGLAYIVDPVRGTMDVFYSLLSTTVGTASQVLSWKLPLSLTTPFTVGAGLSRVSDNGGAAAAGLSRTLASGTTLDWLKMDLSNWAVSSNNTAMLGFSQFSVQ